MAAGDLEFGLLGPLLVRRAGLVVPVQRGKQCALLAALLLNPGRVRAADELAELLWDARPPPSARVTVRNYVKRLRHALGDTGQTRIQTRAGGYLITVAPGELDISRFSALLRSAQAAVRESRWEQAAGQASTALAVWRGEPLEDVDCEPLQQREVPRLAEMRLQALETRLDADLHLGRHTEVIGELRLLVVAHPLREHLHALLMLALYRAGRQAEALAAYQDARHVLVEEVGAEPGAELRDLQARMLRADVALARPEPALPPDREQRPAVPRELPAVPADFTGREHELAELSAALDRAGRRPSGTVVISAIGGTAGVGKTALAVYWGHQVTDQFPDGQLYLNLRGYDPGQPMTSGDALASFLRALGVPGPDIPPGDDERAARYRTLLAGRRMLVILDNAGSAEQVRPLLPGTPGGMTVVTSRDSLAGLVARDGAARLDLDLLPLDDAISLLRSLIGGRVDAASDAARALASQCARLPLALRLAAELAAARPTASLADLVGELGDQQRRLDRLDAGGDPRTAVRAVFSWSLRQLDARTHRAFRLAGLHPGADLDRYSVAALTGSPPHQADHMLVRLAQASLIQPAGPGRYGLHDLLRAYARELTPAQGTGEPAAALTRLFDYYLHTAAAAIDVLQPADSHRRPRLTAPPGLAQPVLGDAAAARGWLDRERANLVAAAGYMSAHSWPGQAIGLAVTLFRHFQISGHYPEAVAIHSCARQAARATGDQAAEATALTNLGAVRVRQGVIQEARADLEQALALARESGDRTCAARALHTLGNICVHEARYEQAASHFGQALIIYRELGDRTGEARTVNNLGVIEEMTGRYEQAREHYLQGLGLYQETGERTGEARAVGNLGCIYRRLGRYRQAAEYVERSLRLSRLADDRLAEAYALTGLGDIRRCEGHYRQAGECYQQALDLLRAFGDRSGQAVALNGLGETLRAADQHAAAIEQHAAALDLASQVGDQHGQAQAHCGLAKAYQASGSPERARPHWQQALAQFSKLGTPEADEIRTELALVDAGARP